MTKCTHCETCEDFFEANRKLKVEGSLKSGLVGELRELLGVDHLKGQRQLEAAVAEVKRLQGIAKKVTASTGRKAASAAAKVLKDPKASMHAKTAAASILTHRVK